MTSRPLGEDMALFARKCAWCGAKLETPTQVERMGRRFCSEGHASQYLQQAAAQGASSQGGCC